MIDLNASVVNVDQPPRSFGEKIYLGPIISGLTVTLRHFVRNFFGRKDVATIQYPEEKHEYSERLRGRHILITRDEGELRCVACFMCETACPADCIHIEAEEDPSAEVEWEKRPVVFEIDLLRCIFCGLCVDACPKEAIVMSRTHELAFARREEAIVGIDQLRQTGAMEDQDLGYRPYF
ncbi:MAG: NADH-quinone oxidoreductase subunit I [Thermoanaerobaculales bacterium]|nr:NADH-quinone oxidoreductase subunit I [Thermoanaerobaculales bacterium]